MFESIYSASVTTSQLFIMAACAVLSGLAFSWLISFKIRANRRFFIVTSIIPFAVGVILSFVNGNIGAGVAFGGAFALTRFRSAQGSSDEIAAVLIAMAGGVPFGLGYVGYGVVILLLMGVLFLAISSLKIFDHKDLMDDRLLKITIPESLDYSSVFDETFDHYLASCENAGVKTTGMGSMFRLSFKIRMKYPSEEKAFIDELRTKNGNLEISMLPYAEPANVM